MVTGGNRTYIWDVDNRLDTVTTGGASSFMSYDYTGIRVKKDGSGGITTYPFSGYEIDPNGVTTKYIRIGIENVAAKKSTGDILFYHNDHLGGVNVITDDWGSRVQLIEYDPWGKVSREEGIGDASRRFTGKMLDPESGLYYYGGRYYDPELGRFISPDPFIGQPDDPQNLNRYSYVINNPVNNIDPDGYFHQVKKKKKKGGFFRSFFGFVVGAVVGFFTGGAGFAIAEAAGFAASTATTIGAVVGGATAGAVSAAINGGNPLLGALIGGAFGFVAGGGLSSGGPIFGSSFGSSGGSLFSSTAAAEAASASPSLLLAAAGGAQFADFFAGRRRSAGDDFEPNIILASHSIRDPGHQDNLVGGHGGGIGGRFTLGDLISGSRVISRRPDLIQLERSGGLSEANRFFNQLTVDHKVAEHVTPRGIVRAAELPGNTRISVRPFSNEGRPTIQINRPDQPVVKIRFE